MPIVINNETGLAEDLSDDLLQKALASGSHGVPLISPEGETVNFPKEEATKLISQGYRQPDPNELVGLFKHGKYGTTEQKIKTFAEGALSDMTLGASAGIERGLGIATPEDMQGRAEENPGIKTLGGLTGFAGSMLTGVGAAPKIIKAGETVAHALGLGLKGATQASKIAGEAVNLATQSAIMATGSEVEKAFVSDPVQTIEGAAAHIGLSAVLGAGAGAAFGAIPPLWKAASESKLAGMLKSITASAEKELTATEGQVTMRPLLKKFISTFGGVGEEAIDEYLAKSDLVNQVPGFHELHEKAYQHIQNITQDLNAKKLNVSKLRSDLKAYESEVRESLKQKGYDLAQATKATQNLSEMALAQMEESITERAYDTAPKIYEAVKKLKEDLWVASSDAFDKASQHEGTLSLEPLFNQVKELQTEILSRGTLEGRQAAEKLGQYAEHLESQFGREVRPPQAKLLIQGLDEVSEYSHNATTFDKALSKQYKAIRHALNERLKTGVAEYGEAMKPVAEKADLLERLESYGTPEEALLSVKRLKTDVNYRNEMPLLRKLEEQTGEKFLDSIENYANPEIREKLTQAIPELKKAEKMAQALEELKNPATQRLMQEQIELSALNQQYLSAEQELAKAMAGKSELAGITEGSLQGKMNSVKQGRSIHGRIQLEGFPGLDHIEALKGKTFPELLDLLRVQEAFEKTATQGSRKVNLYGAVLGSVLGTATGGFGGFLGGIGGGAALGGAMDLYGPKVTKKILDSYLHKFGDLAKASGSENLGATKLALYKMLSGKDPVTPESFKGMVDVASSYLKSEKQSAEAIRALFQGAKVVLPESKANDMTHDKFKKRLETLNMQPEELLGGDHAHLGQGMSEVVGEISSRAMSYLESQRPSEDKLGVLDGQRKPSQIEQATYNRILSIADKPLRVLQYVAQGNITDKDIEVMKTIYPGFYQNISQKIMNEVIEKTSQGVSIPYQRRLSLSKFLGIPLDSSMSVESLISAQRNLSAQPQAQGLEQRGNQAKGALKSLKHSSESLKTPLEQRLTKH